MILEPLAPKVSETMEESLMFPSSRIFSPRCFSEVIEFPLAALLQQFGCKNPVF
jgi:hypothetical protein